MPGYVRVCRDLECRKRVAEGDQADQGPCVIPLRTEEPNFSLKYEVKGETRKIDYKVNPNGIPTFTYIDGAGNEQTETYERMEGKGKKDEKKKKKKGPDTGE